VPALVAGVTFVALQPRSVATTLIAGLTLIALLTVALVPRLTFVTRLAGETRNRRTQGKQ